MEKTKIKKQKSQAFGKEIYLLGEDVAGTRYWLEAPSWDCGWYWGFGYVETYTNNRNPQKSRDIDSHQHIRGMFGKEIEGKYIYNIYNTPLLAHPAFSEKEGWELTELFTQFYLLREMADFSHREAPGCNVTKSPVNHGNLSELNEKINSEMIPRITDKIIEILSPE